MERLKNRRDFLRVAGFRRKWVTPGLILQACPQIDGKPGDSASGSDGPRTRVGFTTSRKVGIAVERNRARRRLRAVADEILRFHARRGYDYVLIGRAATLRRGYADLVNDLTMALKGLKLYEVDGNSNREIRDR